MNTPYVLTRDAENDLREIVRYTTRHWGEVQARRYLTRLSEGIRSAAAGQKPTRDLSAFQPGLRMARCEHHYVFLLRRRDEVDLVVAILHERMDLMARLAERGDR